MSKPQDNSEQRTQWNGPSGTTWAQFQDALDSMLTPVSEALFQAAAPSLGERILDVGCGCGPTTIRMARLVAPGGHVTGIDISGLLLESARERSASLGLPLTFVEADAANYEFKERFDKIVSRFGVMFFADPVAAFANLRGALSPKGEIVFACWRSMGENVWMNGLMDEAAKFLPMPPRPTGYLPGPFAFADRAFLEGMLEKSGFGDGRIEPLSPKLKMPGDTPEQAIEFASRMGPMAGVLREIDDTTRARVEALIKDYVEARFAQGNPPQDAACWIVRARA